MHVTITDKQVAETTMYWATKLNVEMTQIGKDEYVLEGKEYDIC